MHGQAGEGRFCVYAIGRRALWRTTFADSVDNKTKSYEIDGNHVHLLRFSISDPVEAVGPTGTVVELTGIEPQPKGLLALDAHRRLAELFALYLRQYPLVTITYDGKGVNPALLQQDKVDIDLPGLVDHEGKSISAKLTIIEWGHHVDRELVLCDESGFALATKPAGIQAAGYNFTAYLRSDHMRELQRNNFLDLEELNPVLRSMVGAARSKMKDHFRSKAAERARSTVEQWKEDLVYPFSGAPKGEVEKVERQVFDVVALNVAEYLPSFASSDSKSKKFSLQLLKNAIEQSPDQVRRIIQEVLELPKEKLEELVELLDRTTLGAVIAASKVVLDRLDFLAGLRNILFDQEFREKLTERKQLHRILAENTWIFGEEFALTVDDQGLTEVLAKHEHLLRKEPSGGKVDLEGGGKGIVDLMLSRRVPMPRPDQFEHLVVELKRPNKDIDADVLNQIGGYAFAVEADERFGDANVQWQFWAISNEMDAHARRRVTGQSDRPPGMVYRGARSVIWAKTWSEVIEGCRGRLRFFQERLELIATREQGMDRLTKVYARYLPPDPSAKAGPATAKPEVPTIKDKASPKTAKKDGSTSKKATR